MAAVGGSSAAVYMPMTAAGPELQHLPPLPFPFAPSKPSSRVGYLPTAGTGLLQRPTYGQEATAGERPGHGGGAQDKVLPWLCNFGVPCPENAAISVSVDVAQEQVVTTDATAFTAPTVLATRRRVHPASVRTSRTRDTSHTLLPPPPVPMPAGYVGQAVLALPPETDDNVPVDWQPGRDDGQRRSALPRIPVIPARGIHRDVDGRGGLSMTRRIHAAASAVAGIGAGEVPRERTERFELPEGALEPLCRARICVSGFLVLGILRWCAAHVYPAPGGLSWTAHILSSGADFISTIGCLPVVLTTYLHECVHRRILGSLLTLLLTATVCDCGASLIFLSGAGGRVFPLMGSVAVDEGAPRWLAIIGVWESILLSSVSLQLSLVVSVWQYYRAFREGGIYPPAANARLYQEVSTLEFLCEAEDVALLSDHCDANCTRSPDGSQEEEDPEGEHSPNLQGL